MGTPGATKVQPFYNFFAPFCTPETISAKSTSKVWKSYPLQRFKPISKGPRYPKKHQNWTPNGPRNCNLWAKWVPKKTTKKKCWKVINFIKMVSKWGPREPPKFNKIVVFSLLFAPRAWNGPGVVPGSKQGRPRRPKGAKSLPKGSKKSWKRHPKAFQMQISSCLRPSRHRAMIGDCISHCIGCCIGDCIELEIL